MGLGVDVRPARAWAFRIAGMSVGGISWQCRVESRVDELGPIGDVDDARAAVDVAVGRLVRVLVIERVERVARVLGGSEVRSRWRLRL